MKKLAIALALTLVSSLSLGAEATFASTKTKDVNVSTTSAKSAAVTYAWVNTHDGVGVNLRASKSTSSKILAKLPDGTRVTLLSNVVSGWYKVNYNGTIGYISAGYLVDEYGDAPGL